ncbi:MAG: hypothetical protein HY613_07660 [Candidatus Rokubacteria bacterium]|nr:hypothetical protein [Candidatus Rokubacteria bacterium]
MAIRLGPTTRRVQAVLGAWVVAGREAGTGIRRWFRVEVEGGETLSVYYDEALDGWFWREDG